MSLCSEREAPHVQVDRDLEARRIAGEVMNITIVLSPGASTRNATM